MITGFVPTPRRSVMLDLLHKPPLYTKLWMWLLCSANFKDDKRLKRGQFQTSISKMQKEMAYKTSTITKIPTIQEIRSPLSCFVKNNLISIEHNTLGMIITITKYGQLNDENIVACHSEDVKMGENEHNTDTTQAQHSNDSLSSEFIRPIRHEKTEHITEHNTEHNIVYIRKKKEEKNLNITAEIDLLKLRPTRPIKTEIKHSVKKVKTYDPEHLAIAEQIRRITKSQINKNIPDYLILKWADEIRLTINTDGISLDRIKKIMAWYEIHAGEPFVSEIESGKSFRSKITNVEKQMNKSTKQSGASDYHTKPTKIKSNETKFSTINKVKGEE